MTVRKSLIAGSLLLLSPGCKQTPPAETQEPSKPPAAAAPTAAAPAEPPAAPKPREGDPCTEDGASIATGPEESLNCVDGRWKLVDAGFVGVARAGRERGVARRLRA
jgi:hypothetical protein